MNDLTIATTTDSAAVLDAVTVNDEQASRVPAPKPESTDAVSFEHPRSERLMLLERLKQHESDLEALGSSDADYVTTSNEGEEQVGEEAGKEEAEAAAEKAGVDLAAVRKAATEDAITAGRLWAAQQQQNANPVQVEADQLRAQLIPPFAARIAELTKGKKFGKEVDIPLAVAVTDALLSLPGGAETAVFLGEHPAEARKLQTLPEHVAVAHVARLAAQLSPDFQRRPASKAPAPIRPIGGSSTKSSIPSDELPYQEFKKQRELQIKNRYR